MARQLERNLENVNRLWQAVKKMRQDWNTDEPQVKVKMQPKHRPVSPAYSVASTRGPESIRFVSEDVNQRDFDLDERGSISSIGRGRGRAPRRPQYSTSSIASAASSTAVIPPSEDQPQGQDVVDRSRPAAAVTEEVVPAEMNQSQTTAKSRGLEKTSGGGIGAVPRSGTEGLVDGVKSQEEALAAVPVIGSTERRPNIVNNRATLVDGAKSQEEAAVPVIGSNERRPNIVNDCATVYPSTINNPPPVKNNVEEKQCVLALQRLVGFLEEELEELGKLEKQFKELADLGCNGKRGNETEGGKSDAKQEFADKITRTSHDGKSRTE